MSRLVMVVLLSAANAGCFAFHDSAMARPGQTARLTLNITRPSSEDSADEIRYQGLVVESGSGADSAGVISIEQRTPETLAGFREVVTVDTLHIERVDVRRLQVRRASWIRSGMVAVVAGALAYWMWDTFKPSVETR